MAPDSSVTEPIELWFSRTVKGYEEAKDLLARLVIFCGENKLDISEIEIQMTIRQKVTEGEKASR